jgi:hypothetical protein
MMAHVVAGAQTPATTASHQPNLRCYPTRWMRFSSGGASGECAMR